MHNHFGVKRRAVLAAGLSATLPVPTLGVSAAKAQAWPARTITLVVPFAPGGGTDTFARPFAAKLKQDGIVVETRAEWDSEVGRFCRIHDPEGNPIELWEPAKNVEGLAG